MEAVQSHNVMGCAKHYALNSIEETRTRVDARVDERTLREVYLPHFKRLADADVASFMSAYNKVNGDYCGENRHLLREILKEEWGYRGFVMSDFFQGVYDGVKGAKAGLDLEMPWTMAYGEEARRGRREGRGAGGRDRRSGAAPPAPEDRVRDAPGPHGLPGLARPGGRARGPRRGGRGEGHRPAEERRRAAASRRRLPEVSGGHRPARRRAEPRRLRQQPCLPSRHRHRGRGPARRARGGAGRPRARRRSREGPRGGEGGRHRGRGRGLRPVGRGRVHPAEAEQGRVGRRPRGSGAEARRTASSSWPWPPRTRARSSC